MKDTYQINISKIFSNTILKKKKFYIMYLGFYRIKKHFEKQQNFITFCKH